MWEYQRKNFEKKSRSNLVILTDLYTIYIYIHICKYKYIRIFMYHICKHICMFVTWAISNKYTSSKNRSGFRLIARES